MTTERPSRRIQRRSAKSASALFTVSREAPTSCASSSWVRSCGTKMPSGAGFPKRFFMSRMALATRPGTSENTRSPTVSLVRRRRCANAFSRFIAACGRSSSQLSRSSCLRLKTSDCDTAVTVDERGPGSNSASSPMISPGPTTDSRFSRPSADSRPTLSFPVDTM